MPETGLVLSAASALVAGCAFLVVGSRLAARRVEGKAAVAWALFRGWWYGIGVYVLLVGFGLNALAAFGLTPLKVFATARTLGVLLLCLSLACLTFYLLFVFRGRLRDLPWVVAFYGAVHATVTYTFAGRRLTGVDVGAFETRLAFDPAPHPLVFAGILALLTLPQLAAAAAHLALYRRVEDRSQRYRAAMVAGSLALWFASSLVADLGSPDSPLKLLRPLFGLLAAGAVLAAYAPPAWMQRRWGLEPLRAEPLA